MNGWPRMRGWPDFFAVLYIAVIALTVAGMLAYIFLDLRRHVNDMTVLEQVRRMTRWEVLQHAMLATAFVFLIVTGFALRFSGAWWVDLLFGWEGGFPLRNLVHRISAVVLILVGLMHLFYLRGTRGRQILRDIFPSLEDITHFIQMVKYNLGLSKERPAFGRFTFAEKFEYWAMIWGVVIMTVTGLMLWFDNFFVGFLGKGVLDVMLVIHYYEAWLASLSILIWHLYCTIFNPKVYPMNPSWLTGKMPVYQYRDEHPGDYVEYP